MPPVVCNQSSQPASLHQLRHAVHIAASQCACEAIIYHIPGGESIRSPNSCEPHNLAMQSLLAGATNSALC